MAEKLADVEVQSETRPEARTGVEESYAVTTEAAGSQENLKKTLDGKVLLIPQPSDDPEDPLNWSWARKHAVMLALGFAALLTDWGMTWGTTLFEMQALDWHMSVPDVANSVSGGIFLQGAGGVIAVPLAQRFGRWVR
jgi:hypothetical protein